MPRANLCQLSLGTCHCRLTPIQDHAHTKGSAVLLSKRIWGSQAPRYNPHLSISSSWDARQDQNLEELLLRQDKQLPVLFSRVWVDFAGVACQDFGEGKDSFQSHSKRAPEVGVTSPQKRGAIWTLAECSLG